MLIGMSMTILGVSIVIASIIKSITDKDNNNNPAILHEKMNRVLKSSDIRTIHEKWWASLTTGDQKYIIENDKNLRFMVNEFYVYDNIYLTATNVAREAANKNIFIPEYAEEAIRKYLK